MNACGVARASAAESAGVGAETGSGFEDPHAYASATAAGMSRRMPALRQRDVLLDHQVRRQSLDLEPGPRLEGFGAFELSGTQRRVHALLDLALRTHTEVLEKLAHRQIEDFFVHGVTLKT